MSTDTPPFATRARRTLATLTVVLAAIVGNTAAPAAAGAKTATLSFGTIESVARAGNGATIELSGEGSFGRQPKSVSGDGGTVAATFGDVPRTFTHRDADGNVLTEGTWEPTQLVTFQTYGPVTAEQRAEHPELPAASEGGRVKLEVALSVDGVHVQDGLLTIVCLLGEPPDHVVESTLLRVQGTGLNFNEPLTGDNIFIRE